MFAELAKSYGVQNPLFSSNESKGIGNTPVASSSKSTVLPSEPINNPEYVKILTDFYQKYNPSKIEEVQKTLARYKGKEMEMFDKLAKKYNTSNPLKSQQSQISSTALLPTASSTPFAPSLMSQPVFGEGINKAVALTPKSAFDGMFSTGDFLSLIITP